MSQCECYVNASGFRREFRSRRLPNAPIPPIDFIRYVETAAFFDQATRNGVMTTVENGPEKSTRPIEIRSANFTPAVEFVQANRFRMRMMEQMDDAMANIDLTLRRLRYKRASEFRNERDYPIAFVPTNATSKRVAVIDVKKPSTFSAGS